MLIGVLAGDKDIIDVRICEIKSMQDIVNEPLKSLSGILKYEWHSGKFKQPKGSGDGGFRNIF